MKRPSAMDISAGWNSLENEELRTRDFLSIKEGKQSLSALIRSPVPEHPVITSTHVMLYIRVNPYR